MGKLDGKVALVTGGSRGIGRGIVSVLAADGAEVWAVSRNETDLESLKRETEGVHTLVGDVADPEIASLALESSRPNVLVLNAGVTPHVAAIQDQSWKQFSRAWNTDVKASFYFGQLALSMPLAPGSVVVVVSSGAGISGSPVSGGYAGAKRMQWFLAQYFQEASHLLNSRIRFLALLPKQLVATSSVGQAAASAYAERQGVKIETFMDGMNERFGGPLTPEGVGHGVLSLLVDEAFSKGIGYGVTNAGLELLDG